MLEGRLTAAQAARSTQLMEKEDYEEISSILQKMEPLKEAEMKRRPHRGGTMYSLVSLIMIVLYMQVNRKSYAGTKVALDRNPDLLRVMGVPDRMGRCTCPSVGTMNNFVNKIWPQFAEQVSEVMTELFLRDTEEAFYTADSTPLEASRYSKCWHYNQHYSIRMAKMHIIMMNGHPMWYSVTNANDGDNPELLKMLEKVGGFRNNAIGFATDGAYASFETYSLVYRLTGVLMASNPACTSVLHDRITWKHLLKLYSRLWKCKGYRPPNEVNKDRIMRFLIKNGHSEEVGKFLRNVDMRRGRMSAREKQNRRHVCEEVHKAAKRWMPLDVRGLREKTAKIMLSFRFFLMQLFSYIFPEYR